MEVEQKIIISNNERFIKDTYNGIAVIIREKDGFVNGSKLCYQFGKNKAIYHLFENKTWGIYFEEFKLEYGYLGGARNSVNPIYELKNGYISDVTGIYVDPRLVNYIAIWASPKYAVYVGKIMDTINNIGKAKLIDDTTNMEEVLNNLNKELEEYKKKNKELIAERELNKELIYEEAVRSNDVKDRKLTIYRENDVIKMSADNKKSFKTFIIQYTFPASMNIRMQLKKEKLYNKLSDISNEEYIDIRNYLDSLNPKSRVEGIDFI